MEEFGKLIAGDGKLAGVTLSGFRSFSKECAESILASTSLPFAQQARLMEIHSSAHDLLCGVYVRLEGASQILRHPPEVLHENSFSRDGLVEISSSQLPAHFVSMDWTAVQVNSIKYWLEEEDGKDVTTRVPPMALVSCSAGGKTRALEEIGRAIQQSCPDITVVLVSFNTLRTSYHPTETDDPFNSLLSRIAYSIAIPAVRTEPLHDAFGNLRFITEEQSIVRWLGNSKCILLIDELNCLVTDDREPRTMQKISLFLKQHFLAKRGRYLVFTSHRNITSTQLVQYMAPSDEGSERRVMVRALPIFTRAEEVKNTLAEKNVGS